MSDSNAMHINSAVDHILSVLDDEPQGGTSEREQEDADAGIDPSSVAFDADDDTATDDEADLPIAPPSSWKADAKNRFRDLPRDLQKVISDRERERETHFSRTQQETAEARKAALAERAAVQNERQA
jgi:hypothetical protein